MENTVPKIDMGMARPLGEDRIRLKLIHSGKEFLADISVGAAASFAGNIVNALATMTHRPLTISRSPDEEHAMIKDTGAPALGESVETIAGRVRKLSEGERVAHFHSLVMSGYDAERAAKLLDVVIEWNDGGKTFQVRAMDKSPSA